MPWVRDTDLSVRENILEFWRDKLSSVTAGSSGYLTTFDSVIRAPLTKPEHTLRAAAGIVDLAENKVAEIGYMLCRLQVSVEFCVTTELGEQPSSALNRCLLDIQRCFRSDITSGGLSYQITEFGSETQADSGDDRLGLGVVTFEILYRHHVDDPRKLVGE